MLLKGAYCVGEHFVDPQCFLVRKMSSTNSKNDSVVPFNSISSLDGR